MISMTKIPTRPPFFDATEIDILNRYVVWLDLMGSRAIMARSLKTAANFIFKLHVAALESSLGGIKLYPMNDGTFAVGDDLKIIKEWLADIFERVHLANVAAKCDHGKVFMVRAAIAFGPVAEGASLPRRASDTLDVNLAIRDAVLLGAPVANAFVHERLASPFGIYVHESGRTFAPSGKTPWTGGSFMRYWSNSPVPSWVSDCKKIVLDYLEHCRKHANELEYQMESIDRHRALIEEYFDF